MLYLSTITAAYGDIFILHGSFGSDSRWFRPNGTFYEAVKKQAAPLGHDIHPFIWSGGVSPQSIIEGAKSFIERMLTLPPNTPIIIEAHSNGGNVAAFTTMLYAALYKAQATDETEVPDIIRSPFLEKKLTKNRTYIYEVAPKVESLLQETFTELKEAMNTSHRLRRTLPDYPIQLLCLMGTPINTDRFDINMQVVRQVINLYSPADFIQPLVGDQVVPIHERRANIQVKLHDVNLGADPIDPCHKNIRNQIIGQWLLELPDIAASTKEDAAPYSLQSGIATFYSDQPPLFVQTDEANQPASSDDSDSEEEDDSWPFDA